MKERVLRISPDGTKVVCLYDDGLLSIGKPTNVVRASHVRFVPEEGCWKVFFRYHAMDRGIVEDPVGPAFETRQAAINFEVEFCNNFLARCPRLVSRLMSQQKFLSDDSG
jgi:hypothetical protein